MRPPAGRVPVPARRPRAGADQDEGEQSRGEGGADGGAHPDRLRARPGGPVRVGGVTVASIALWRVPPPSLDRAAPRQQARRRPDRHLRLRLRRPDGRPVRHRPAPARVGALRRRHRAPALRPQADRRGPRVRPRVPRPPRRTGREGAGHRLQLGQRRDAARRPRALRRARGRGDLPGHPPRRRGHPYRPDRRHLHPVDRGVDGLRRRVRRRAARHPEHAGLPAVRRLRRGRRDRRRRADRASPTSTSTRWWPPASTP